MKLSTIAFALLDASTTQVVAQGEVGEVFENPEISSIFSQNTYVSKNKTPLAQWANRETSVALFNQYGKKYVEVNDVTYRFETVEDKLTGENKVIKTEMTKTEFFKDKIAFWISSSGHSLSYTSV